MYAFPFIMNVARILTIPNHTTLSEMPPSLWARLLVIDSMIGVHDVLVSVRDGVHHKLVVV